MDNVKILIADDDQDIRDSLQAILETRKYTVITAADRDEGMEKIKTEKPDLLILDVMMNEPDDGFYLAQKLRREKIDTPIIMYTSVSKALGINFGRSEIVPVDEFVEKPISPDELIEKVEKLLHTGIKE